MIGSPRKKTGAELSWSRVKRAITARVNYEAQVWREQELQDRLDEAWTEFKQALDKNEIPDDDKLELP